MYQHIQPVLLPFSPAWEQGLGDEGASVATLQHVA